MVGYYWVNYLIIISQSCSFIRQIKIYLAFFDYFFNSHDCKYWNTDSYHKFDLQLTLGHLKLVTIEHCL